MKLKVAQPTTALLTIGKSIVGAHSIGELCSLLKRPRRVMLLVKAGPAVDDFIEALLPHLEKGSSRRFSSQLMQATSSSMVEIHISPIPIVDANTLLIRGTRPLQHRLILVICLLAQVYQVVKKAPVMVLL
jgi:hypothetical protein